MAGGSASGTGSTDIPNGRRKRYSLRGYAASRARRGLRGGTLAAVQRAIKDGRILKGLDGKLDREEADSQWHANTRASRSSASEKRDDPDTEYKRWRARLAELEYHERNETLGKLEEIETAGFLAGRLSRERVLGIPVRLSAELASEKDPRIIEQLLMAALLEALEGTANDARDAGLS